MLFKTTSLTCSAQNKQKSGETPLLVLLALLLLKLPLLFIFLKLLELLELAPRSHSATRSKELRQTRNYHRFSLLKSIIQKNFENT